MCNLNCLDTFLKSTFWSIVLNSIVLKNCPKTLPRTLVLKYCLCLFIGIVQRQESIRSIPVITSLLLTIALTSVETRSTTCIRATEYGNKATTYKCPSLTQTRLTLPKREKENMCTDIRSIYLTSRKIMIKSKELSTNCEWQTMRDIDQRTNIERHRSKDKYWGDRHWRTNIEGQTLKDKILRDIYWRTKYWGGRHWSKDKILKVKHSKQIYVQYHV